MIVRRYSVDICDGCLELQGQECHTPGCIFFLCGMKEVADRLDQMLIRPRILEGMKGEPPYHKSMQRQARIVSREK